MIIVLCIIDILLSYAVKFYLTRYVPDDEMLDSPAVRISQINTDLDMDSSLEKDLVPKDVGDSVVVEPAGW